MQAYSQPHVHILMFSKWEASWHADPTKHSTFLVSSVIMSSG